MEKLKNIILQHFPNNAFAKFKARCAADSVSMKVAILAVMIEAETSDAFIKKLVKKHQKKIDSLSASKEFRNAKDNRRG